MNLQEIKEECCDLFESDDLDVSYLMPQGVPGYKGLRVRSPEIIDLQKWTRQRFLFGTGVFINNTGRVIHPDIIDLTRRSQVLVLENMLIGIPQPETPDDFWEHGGDYFSLSDPYHVDTYGEEKITVLGKGEGIGRLTPTNYVTRAGYKQAIRKIIPPKYSQSSLHKREELLRTIAPIDSRNHRKMNSQIDEAMDILKSDDYDFLPHYSVGGYDNFTQFLCDFFPNYVNQVWDKAPDETKYKLDWIGDNPSISIHLNNLDSSILHGRPESHYYNGSISKTFHIDSE